MKQTKLSENICSKIDHWVQKFPAGKQKSAVLMALTSVQDECGFLSEDLMDAVAAYLALPKTAVYEVASFYSMYNLKPVGKYYIKVCDSISCKLCGSSSILEHLKQTLGINLGETTADNLFTLGLAECLASCCDAPVLIINDKKYHDNLTTQKVDDIIANLKDEAK
jgi:NADH-quinone oxidoreductase subunit E